MRSTGLKATVDGAARTRQAWSMSEAREDTPKDGKSLWTEREYGNFVLRVDWRIKETPFVNKSIPYILPDGTDRWGGSLSGSRRHERAGRKRACYFPRRQVPGRDDPLEWHIVE